MSWTQADAVALCRELETIAPLYDAHVALTGGCLYKDGPRRDADIMFYSIRQAENGVQEEALLNAIHALPGFEILKRYGWVVKAKYHGKPLDLFFPEYVATGGDGEY
jgi:hypothetical protein